MLIVAKLIIKIDTFEYIQQLLTANFEINLNGKY